MLVLSAGNTNRLAPGATPSPKPGSNSGTAKPTPASLNGAAYGQGFALCQTNGCVQTCSDTLALCEMLSGWLRFPQFASAALPVADPA